MHSHRATHKQCHHPKNLRRRSHNTKKFVHSLQKGPITTKRPPHHVASLLNISLQSQKIHTLNHHKFSTSNIQTTISDSRLFQQESQKVLESILSYLEQDSIDMEFNNDVEFSGDVLNLRTENNGTWVLNKHGVTKQIWLSSPKSGPSKYNYVPPGFAWGTDHNRIYNIHNREGLNGIWLDERNGETKLSDVLKKEWSEVFGSDVVFSHDF